MVIAVKTKNQKAFKGSETSGQCLNYPDMLLKINIFDIFLEVVYSNDQ